jgi:small subunit ribosomal protein S19
MEQENRSISIKRNKYRGIPIEELTNMPFGEFKKLLLARERRSLARGEKLLEKFIKKAEKKISKNKMPKTHLRDLVIVPQMLDWNIGIHNGKEYVQVKIVPDMLGHRLGEFALTRRTVKHGKAGVGATKGTSSLSVK